MIFGADPFASVPLGGTLESTGDGGSATIVAVAAFGAGVALEFEAPGGDVGSNPIFIAGGVELLGPKKASESRTATFDFADEAAAASSLVSAVVTIAWIGGPYDGNASAMLLSVPQIAGKTVLQAFVGGVPGAVYAVTATATDSTGNVHEIAAQLVVESEAAIFQAAWSEFAPEVLQHAPECPSFIIERHIVAAAREFFVRSHAWRSEKQTLLVTEAGLTLYRARTQANAAVHRLHAAWANGKEVNVLRPGEEDDTPLPAVRNSTWGLSIEPGSLVSVTPPPLTAGIVVTGTVSFVPAKWATGIPRELFTRWGDMIACYAAAKLVMQPGKPWSNPKAYSVLMGCFDDAVREASNEAGPVSRRGIRVRMQA